MKASIVKRSLLILMSIAFVVVLVFFIDKSIESKGITEKVEEGTYLQDFLQEVIDEALALEVEPVTEPATEPDLEPDNRIDNTEASIADKPLPNVDDEEKIIAEEMKNIKYAKEIPVLAYHHILRDEENLHPQNGSIISLDLFEEHMKYIHDEGYKTITLRELELFLKGELKLPQRSLLITFDDGYKSNIVYAYPILKKYNLKATLFIISGYTTEETVEFNPQILQYASWEELAASTDVFEYGGHTHNFHRMDNGQSYLITKPIEAVKEDLRKNLEIIKGPYFAYPYGHYNDETLEALTELGYKLAFTVDEGNAKPGEHTLKIKRRGIYSFTSLKKLKSILK